MPKSLGQFLALVFDSIDAFVKHSSNARKSNGTDHHTQNESKYKFSHDSSLFVAGFNPLAGGCQILTSTLNKARCSMAGSQRQCNDERDESFHTVSLNKFHTVQLSFSITVTFYSTRNGVTITGCERRFITEDHWLISIIHSRDPVDVVVLAVVGTHNLY